MDSRDADPNVAAYDVLRRVVDKHDEDEHADQSRSDFHDCDDSSNGDGEVETT